MFCYCTEAFYSKLDDSKNVRDVKRSEGPVYRHLYDAVEYFRKQGFNEVPSQMWPTASRPSLVWHGRKKVSDNEHVSAYVMMQDFIG